MSKSLALLQWVKSGQVQTDFVALIRLVAWSLVRSRADVSVPDYFWRAVFAVTGAWRTVRMDRAWPNPPGAMER
jgi:hypothetical protein